MIKSIAVAVALMACLPSEAAARPQSADDLARREAIVRELFLPSFEEGMRAPIEESWSRFPASAVHPAELAALRSAHEREVDALVKSTGDRVASIIARHVPLEQLRADADMETPEWRTATAETMSAMQQTAVRDGIEMAMRVIETGCSVSTPPSPTCADRLAIAADYRAGRVKLEDFQPD